MNRLTKLILGCGLFLVLAGGLLALGGWALGGQTSLDIGGLRLGHGGAGRWEEKTDLELAAFETLDLDVSLGDITIQEGASYGVELAWCGDNYRLEYSNENGELRVWSENERIGLNTGHTDARVVVTVPRATVLKLVDVSADLGEVTISDLSADRLVVGADLGDVTLAGITARDTEFYLSLGGLEGDRLKLDGTLLVENSLGDISLIGDISGDITLASSMGNVALYTSQPADRFGYELEVSMGTIEVDGVEYTKDASRTGGSDFIAVENDMGDIEVLFGY